MPVSVWIVHNGADDSSPVLGLGTDFEACLDLIRQSYTVDHTSIVIEFPYSDTAQIKVSVAGLYGVHEYESRRFALIREFVTGA